MDLSIPSYGKLGYAVPSYLFVILLAKLGTHNELVVTTYIVARKKNVVWV